MSLLKHAPRFRVEEASRLARDLYGLEATATPLPSERDQNFLLQADDRARFVLKIANGREEREMLLARQQAMSLVASQTGLCPSPLPTASGQPLAQVEDEDGASYFVWLITHLSGVLLAEVPRHSPALLADLGRCLGRIDRALAYFDHPALHRRFHWDLQNGLQVVREQGERVADPDLRRRIGRFAADFERRVAPRLDSLRRSAIHNDANDYNVIVAAGDDLATRYEQVQGVVDFGDMVYSLTVAEPAVALAYAILDKPDPLAAATHLVRGYHAVTPLREEEVAVLWDLACLRLCLSACLAATQQEQRPDDPYLAISQVPIRRTLPRLLAVHPRFAAAAFRHACGWTPSPAETPVRRWLRSNGATFAPVLAPDLFQLPPLILDLSVSTPLIEGDPQQIATSSLQQKISGALAAAGTALGVGRHDEARLLYTGPALARSPFDAGDAPGAERRTVHLGLDLFAPAGSAVHAPLNGAVHSLNDPVQILEESGEGPEHGPTVVLRHETDDGHTFCTLYRGLSSDSLAGLRLGQTLDAGEPFAAIAVRDDGPLPPHLHFQVIVDLLELGAAFPGVVRASERAVWRSLSPDPRRLLGVPEASFPPPAPGKATTLARRQRSLGGNLSLSYRDPLKIVRGWMQYLYDESGRRYLDAYNNVPHVGHCHPRVVAAARQQMGLLNTNTRYLHDAANRFAERLSATLPDPLEVCYFVNSGSEANELALRLARAHTGQRDMIVLEAAYHGNTNSLIDISPYKHDGPGGQGAPAWVHAVPLPDLYRGPYRRSDPQAAHKYAQHVQAVIARLQEQGRGPVGYMAESLPSVGGQIVFPHGYLAAVYRHVRAAGGVCIADEVQTAYGRVGTHFYGFEMQDVVPDIVVLGKPIGNGHPLAAVVTTPDIAASFDNGMEFFSTFGGNTVSCAVGLAVLQVVQEEGLQAHALRVGNHLLTGLRPFLDRHPLVGDVRGSGLFLGVELVRDRETREPAGEEAALIANRMRQRGILLGTDGPDHNVLKIRPPMPFSTADADHLLETLDDILATEFSSGGAAAGQPV